jgi:hypothetical protein
VSAIDRERLGRLADELIPSESGMPSATEAGAVGEYLDRVLELRPDLEAPLAAITALDPEGDPAGFAAITAAVTGAYYMNPDVAAKVGYAGQAAIPFAPDHEDYLEDGLLDSVKSRPPVYRPTP